MSISSLAAPKPPETIAPAPGTGLSMVAQGALKGASYGSNLSPLGAGIGAVGGAMHSLMKFKQLQEDMRLKDLENKKRHARDKSMLRQEGQATLNAEAAGTGYFQNMYAAQSGGTIPSNADLKNLSTKSEIKELQSNLIKAGFDIGKFGDNKDGVDGILGKKTKDALVKYSKKNPATKDKYFKISEPDSKNHNKELQKRLVDLGYDLGTSGENQNGVDGIIGEKTKKALEQYEKDSVEKLQPDVKAVSDKIRIVNTLPLHNVDKKVPYKTFSKSQHKLSQTKEDKSEEKKDGKSPYKEIDSRKADIFRKLIPAPVNVSQMLSKTILKDARMGNESLSDEQKLILWDVIKNAQSRSGKSSGGGTEYSDYGNLGYGTSEEFNEWFNRGKIEFKDGVSNSMSNPAFTLASTIGRGRYWIDEENPDVIEYTDVYDWNSSEKDFKEDNIYQKLRNKVRSGEDKNLNADKNEKYRMNFRLSKKEIDAIRNKKAAEGVLAILNNKNGGQIPQYFLGSVISSIGSKVVSGLGSTLLNKGKEKLAGMAGDLISGAADKATAAVGNVLSPKPAAAVDGAQTATPSQVTPPAGNVAPGLDEETIKKIAQAVSNLISKGGAVPAGSMGLKLSEHAVADLVKMNSEIGRSKTVPVEDDDSVKFRDGGSMSVIPKGVLHGDSNKLGDNGIPVVIKKKGGEFRKVAEIEKEEIIFSIAVTKELEKYAEKLKNKKITDKELIRVGNLVRDEVINNTVDITGEML